MLAPGELLTSPSLPESARETAVLRGAATTSTPELPTAPAAGVQEPERPSFLLTLLRALGAVHT